MFPTARVAGFLSMKNLPCSVVLILCLTLGVADALAQDRDADSAQGILDAAGVRGGLVVHLDCNDGKLTAALAPGKSFVVDGLDTDPAQVAAARRYVQSLGIYGRVSVRHFNGDALPYADNLVNLLVAEDLGGLDLDEAMRVLAPGGVALIGDDGKWARTVKPRPAEIDEWSHFLHDASNNAVASDSLVGPPRRLQWTAGPPWCRSHEFISSFCAMVSAGGRVFYVIDEGQPGVTDGRLPQRWVLVARDAFNGVLLWKRPLPDWRADEWTTTAMRGRPASVPRRIVADGDRLYATLSHQAPLCILDAATGKTLRTVEGTEGTQEIALVGRTLVLRLARLEQDDETLGGAVATVDADTGNVRWRVREDRFMAQSLAADAERVIYNDTQQTVCLDLDDGTELWQTSGKRAEGKRAGEMTFILQDGQVLETDGSRIVARSAKTGETLWTTPTGGSAMRGHDMFVTGGRVWHAASEGIVGYDLKTGEPARTIDPSGVQSRGHHLRCYRSKATERFLITQFRGAEFVSLTDENHCQNDWVRGSCRYGVMPCNGMFYAPPHQCFCFTGAMMNGMNAFTTASDDELNAIGSQVAAGRLQRGPAYEEIRNPKSEIRNDDWPMYRHDARRSGATASEVPANLAGHWQVKIGGRLTPPVAADGRVYIAAKDRHTVYALDAQDGRRLWQFTADAGIDSPPTVYQGRVLFGCADGCVYCVRASDGALAWRFQAAPNQRLIVAESRLESAWRVHGSVLVLDGVAYCTAGRSSFLDGGLYLYGLDPATGEVVHENRLHTLMATREDVGGEPFLPAFHIQGTRSDLLVAEGGHIYLNQMKFTPDLKRQETRYVPHDPEDQTAALDVTNQPYVAENPYLSKGFQTAAALGVWRGHMGDQEVGRHLFSTGGLLDDSWWNRTYWMYAETWPGYQLGHIAPKAGQLLAVGDETTYAVQAYPTRNIHSPMFTPESQGYLLIADANDNEPVLDYRSWGRDKGMGFARAAPPKWHRWVPIRMRSMVLAGKHLFAAGPPDVVPEDDPYAALDGRKGGLLWTFSAEDGEKLAERELPAEPVFDGLIAAGGRLYASLKDGTMVCLGPR